MANGRPTPLTERTHPQITVMLSTDQVSAKIEQVTDNGMGAQKTLGLLK